MLGGRHPARNHQPATIGSGCGYRARVEALRALEVLLEAADAVGGALSGLGDWGLAGTRDGQYRSDLAADEAALAVLGKAGLGVLSEESGLTDAERDVVVVLDPLDGSTNASRGIPWYATSLCAVDADGPLAAVVVNLASGRACTATRGGGAFVDGVALQPSAASVLRQSIVGLSGFPPRYLGWKQFRALGRVALDLCAVAAGTLDGYVDCSRDAHGVWDYAGGLLMCSEVGVPVVDAFGRDLLVLDPAARRTPVAGATQALLDELVAARDGLLMHRVRALAHQGLLKVFQRLPRKARVSLVHLIAPGFTVGAICQLERDDGAILLVRHAYRHRWGLPGGLLQRGEAAPDAVVREAMEEVGVAIVVLGEPAVVVDPKPRRVDVVFRARLADPADAARVAPGPPRSSRSAGSHPMRCPSSSSRPPGRWRRCAARPARGPRSQGASSLTGPGRIAQLVERLPYKEDVGGSSPSAPTRFSLVRGLEGGSSGAALSFGPTFGPTSPQLGGWAAWGSSVSVWVGRATAGRSGVTGPVQRHDGPDSKVARRSQSRLQIEEGIDDRLGGEPLVVVVGHDVLRWWWGWRLSAPRGGPRSVPSVQGLWAIWMASGQVSPFDDVCCVVGSATRAGRAAGGRPRSRPCRGSRGTPRARPRPAGRRRSRGRRSSSARFVRPDAFDPVVLQVSSLEPRSRRRRRGGRPGHLDVRGADELGARADVRATTFRTRRGSPDATARRARSRGRRHRPGPRSARSRRRRRSTWQPDP